VSAAQAPAPSQAPPRALVFGCQGLTLTPDERALFRAADPLGFILFRRNCDTPEQLRRLVAELRESVGRAEAPVLIDQEGGRVARLRPPHWPAHPPAQAIGALARHDRAAAAEAAWLNARLIAAELFALGITVDCAPVADVPVAGAHDVIGDRAFSDDPALVAELALASCRGLLDGGVLPVIKHLPGHGRAEVDSHHELPVVTATADQLEHSDFLPFRALAGQALGMVAHVVYPAFDDLLPASTSPTVIGEVIRGRIGFDGLLFSDDLSMKALDGSAVERAGRVLAAGCDVVLHCDGTFADMAALVPVVPPLGPAAQARWTRALSQLQPPAPADLPALRARFDHLLGLSPRGLSDAVQ